MLKVAAGTLNQLPLDLEGNATRITQCVESAKIQGVNILCLPELCLSGYGCEDMFLAPFFLASAKKQLKNLIPLSKNILFNVGLPILINSKVYNAQAVLYDEKLLGFYLKQNLASDGVHYEPRWFSPWTSLKHQEIDFFGKSIFAGDLIFKVGGYKLTFEICQDAWVSKQKLSGVTDLDLVLNPSASHFALGKNSIRESLVQNTSRECCCIYLYANLLGNEAGRLIYEGNRLIADAGNVLVNKNTPSFKSFELSLVSVDPEKNKAEKLRLKLGSENLENQAFEVESLTTFPRIGAMSNSDKKQFDSNRKRFVEFTDIVSLGLWDYLRKSSSKGFVISLSGGADSGAVFLLCVL